ncbi:MAG: tyrosine-type recombinase/integrase [Pseudomonadota bacterium]
MRLTDLQIRKLRPPERGQRTHYDEALRGFGVRVSQGGSKSFVVMFGRDRRLRTIGRYPEMSLADARIEAKRVQADMALDLVTAPVAVPQISFHDARERFLLDCDGRTRPRTVFEYRRLLTRHFHYEKDIAELTRADIMGVIDRLKRTPSEQKHAFVAIRTMVNWCRKRGWLEASPVPTLTFATAERSRVLSDEELRRVWLRAAAFGYPFGPIIQLLILTGQRRSEVGGLRRSWIEDDLLILPASFTKNRREHIVPLGPMARAVIAELPESGDLLFPARGREDVAFSGWSKSKRAFDKPLEIEGYTLHDLRRTYSSTMARLGTPIHVTEKLLNHVSGTISGVAAIYNRHSYVDEMRTALERYEGHIAKVVGDC